MAVCWCWIVGEAISLPPASNLINTTVERPVRVILSERSESNAERDTQWRDLGRLHLYPLVDPVLRTPLRGSTAGFALRMTRTGGAPHFACFYA